MATTPWAIPTGKAITGATYIKDTDNNIAATIEDLVDWCNNANGTYNDYTLTGLRTDFLSVSTAQAITSVKTVDTGGAIDFTNGQLRIGGVAVTSTAAELNILDGVTSTATEINVLDGIPATLTAIELGYVDGVTSSIQAQIDGKSSLSGATFTGQVKGITPVSSEDLTRKDYVDSKTVNIVSGTYTPTISASSNIDTATAQQAMYQRSGNIVTVAGAISSVNTTATGFTTITISLPIASALATQYDLSGNVSNNVSDSGYVQGVTATGEARLALASSDSVNSYGWGYTFSYIVK